MLKWITGAIPVQIKEYSEDSAILKLLITSIR